MVQENRYRVISTYSTAFNGKPVSEGSPIWEGALTELIERFPLADERTGREDPLGYTGKRDGLFVVRYSFELQLDDGTWSKVDDPRPLFAFSGHKL